MRAALSVATALALAAGLSACGPGETESTLTKVDVERKLTVTPPPAGTKQLTKATCVLDGKNEYVCQVTTEDDDDVELKVVADGDDIVITRIEAK